ncbi:C-reactive protein-like [Clavelina lepadiformis]|uniref:C-reactive protein-like n=1 Tax=Clavelina lepadiformis TaxID=159417 RepID=UPI004041B91F
MPLKNKNQFVFVISVVTSFLVETSYGQTSDPQAQHLVPVCAYVPEAMQRGHSNAGFYRGVKGDPGIVGKQGPKGEKGVPGEMWNVGGCPTITYHFPRDNQITDYVWYRSYVPRMTEATACAWLETSEYNHHATWISYTTSNRDNEFFIAFINPTTVRLAIAGKGHDFTVPQLTSETKMHFCVWFSSKRRQVGISINAKSVSVLSYTGEIMNGGASMLLAQEQDSVNAGSLDASQAFHGNITNPMMWPRVLSEDEISNLVHRCECPVDHAITFTLDRAELYGSATYSIPDVCPII